MLIKMLTYWMLTVVSRKNATKDVQIPTLSLRMCQVIQRRGPVPDKIVVAH